MKENEGKLAAGQILAVACLAALGAGCGQTRAAVEPQRREGTRARFGHLLPETAVAYGVVEVPKLLKEGAGGLDFVARALKAGSRAQLYRKIRRTVGLDVGALGTVTIIGLSGSRTRGEERPRDRSGPASGAVVVVDREAFDEAGFKSDGALFGAGLFRLRPQVLAAVLQSMVIIGPGHLVKAVLVARAAKPPGRPRASRLWAAARRVSDRCSRWSWGWLVADGSGGTATGGPGRNGPAARSSPFGMEGIRMTSVILGPGRAATVRVRGLPRTVRTLHNGLKALLHFMKSRGSSSASPLPPNVDRAALGQFMGSLRISSSKDVLRIRIHDITPLAVLLRGFAEKRQRSGRRRGTARREQSLRP